MESLCVVTGGNTGKPLCDVPIGALSTLMFTRAKEFTEEDLSSSDNLKAAIQAAMLLPNSNNDKLFPFPIMKSITDNTGDPTVETYQDGTEEVTVEPVPKYLLESKIGFCQAQALAKLNGWTGKFYFIDNTGKFFFVGKDDGGGKGFSTGNLYTDAPRPKGFTGLASTKTRLSAGSIAEFKSGLRAVPANFDALGLVNIVDVDLALVSTVADVVTVKGKIRCSNEPIFAAYANTLDDPDAWEVKNAATGAVIPVTAVAADTGNGGWDITFTTGVATGTKLTVSLVSPADLVDLDVTGIETAPLLFTKAA